MPRVYLDVCCLNRPFDDQRQRRIQLESEALQVIVDRLQMRAWVWLSSDAVELEVSFMPDPSRRRRVQELAAQAHERVPINPEIVDRATELEALGFGAADALHLACAEAGRADVLLTTDDKLERRAARMASRLRVFVENPVKWIKEGRPS